ncbi:PadR family transcriptional regulator [Paenibacillus favisporus]|uniref:PadR family transcriptional regulator n=1 Tax=Paenibacillus TaxID=44249 RepID=UPI0011A672B9|nr:MULTISPECIES: PadR family transcriptional regulator [Paenibacillus]MEC0179170.1 PadR family transcriptional regulator [Paenibacillus favisporus]
MNTLGYAILGVLARTPCSGYELAAYLEVLWPAKHSQIYPLLNKMEQKGLVAYEHVEQTGRPDKKTYSITDQGREALGSWVEEKPADPAVRDEFLIKVYSMWLTDEENARKLILERISKLKLRVTVREKKIASVEKDHTRASSKHFGRYVLLNRSNFLDKEEISWCKWVLNLMDNPLIVKFVIGFIGAGTFNTLIRGISMLSEC